MSASVVERNGRISVRDADGAQWFAQLVSAAKRAAAPELSVGRMREVALAFAGSELAHRSPPKVAREDVELPCGVRASWFRPAGARREAPLIYFHGGGYVCGSIDASAGLAAQIATHFAAPLLAVGYRQAPEHSIPAAIVDAHTAHAWATTQTEAPITLIGDSAGGQLAVSAASMACRAGLRQPRAVIAVSAWFDLSMQRPSWTLNAARDFSTVELGRFFRDAYLQGRPVEAAQTRKEDLAQLCPTLVVMGGAELAFDDAAAFVEDARASGADVTFEVYEDLPHNFVRYASSLSLVAIERMAAWERAL
jgi:epsilon-lactone hydrolase